ncbi:MAG: hypothetical protein AB7O32_12910 [Vicinamibacterales bacterium]
MTGRFHRPCVRVRLRAMALIVSACAAAACGNDTPTTPTTPTTTTRESPATENFVSNLSVQGSAWRFINAIQAGTVTATMTATDQPSTAVGLGIGLRSSLSGCLVTREIVAAAGASPQISATVDAGDYCIKVFDVGQVATPMAFTVSITYP